MHNCTCCAPCQRELIQLRQKHQEILIDYPLLRQRAAIHRQTLEIYRQENVALNAVRVQLQARVAQLQEELNNRAVVEGRREERKVDQLVRVINCKNGEILTLKHQIDTNNVQLQSMGKKILELQAENSAANSRLRVLQGLVRNTTVCAPSYKDRVIQTPKDTTFSAQTSILPMSFPLCQHSRTTQMGSNARLDMINSRIDQLQVENTRLRQKLKTHI